MSEPSERTALRELQDINAARWEMVEILLGKTTGDLEVLWPQAVEAARQLVGVPS